MSKYTTELRYILETLAGFQESQGFSMIDTIIAQAAPKLFDFDYGAAEWVDTNRLQKAICLAYYTREIGCETYGLWKLQLMQKMREIMPKYNEWYRVQDIRYNPLNNIDLWTTDDKKNEGSRTQDSTSNDTVNDDTNLSKTGKNTNVITGTDRRSGTNTDATSSTGSNSATSKFSDTPQGGLTGLQTDQYLTTAQMDSTSGTQKVDVTHGINETLSKTDNATFNIDERHTTSRDMTSAKTENLSMQEKFLDNSINHVSGKTGGDSYTKLIVEYRESILSVDAAIIEELKVLFMGLW